MKTLLVGGAGYVGSACLRWLLKHGHDAIAYDSLLAGNAAAVPADRLIVGDLADRDLLIQTMAEHRIEAVMHFAALASVPESIQQPETYYRTNVLGTKNVLDAMLHNHVNRIVFSSTAATYGFENEMPLTEQSLQDPQVPYGRTKLAAEYMIRDYARAHGFGCGLLRYFNASGADPDGEFGEDRQHETHLIPLVLQTAVGGREKLLVFGGDWDTRDGTCVRDYVHTEDLAQAHQLAIEAAEPGFTRAYNLGTGNGTTVFEVIQACEDVVGRKLSYEVVDSRPGDPAVLVASSEKIKKELAWKPQFAEIRQIVETAWKWHQNYPRGYADKLSSTT